MCNIAGKSLGCESNELKIVVIRSYEVAVHYGPVAVSLRYVRFKLQSTKVVYEDM